MGRRTGSPKRGSGNAIPMLAVVAAIGAACSSKPQIGGAGGGAGGTAGSHAGGNSAGPGGGVGGTLSGGMGGTTPVDTGGGVGPTGGAPGTGGVLSNGGNAGGGAGGAMAAGGGPGGTSGASGSASGGAGAGGTTNTGCPTTAIAFVPRVATITLLVDRSGSMFHCATGPSSDPICADSTNTPWYQFKTAIESVMIQLDAQVRFGFATIWGTNPASGGMCPSLQGMSTNAVAPALNNAATIAAVYDALPFPAASTQSGVIFESPVSASIAVTASTLMADASAGGKSIVLVTDGTADYCDDSNALCAPDSVVYQLQKAFAAGIKTVVFGAQTRLFDLAPGVLQAFANAGAGEPTLAPVGASGTVNDFYNQCSGVAGWAADRVAAGRPAVAGTTIGTYSSAKGPTMPYGATASNQSQLVSQLSAAVSSLRDCNFDLAPVGDHPIKVDRTQLASAHVCLSKSCPAGEIPPDATNGWSMPSDTQVALNGSACAAWRVANGGDIAFAFPCASIVIQ